jgi:metal-responsive CopG/Arc/MetJ family transcriptional regulator
MKMKTSITISEDLIQRIDAFYGGHKNRSEFIEKAVRDYLEMQAKKNRDMDDFAILNRKACKLNKEAADVLTYQADL